MHTTTNMLTRADAAHPSQQGSSSCFRVTHALAVLVSHVGFRGLTAFGFIRQALALEQSPRGSWLFGLWGKGPSQVGI